MCRRQVRKGGASALAPMGEPSVILGVHNPFQKSAGTDCASRIALQVIPSATGAAMMTYPVVVRYVIAILMLGGALLGHTLA